jgi:PAS domain-containing protein
VVQGPAKTREQWGDLRRRAEEKLAAQLRSRLADLPHFDVDGLAHELSVYHVELEIQNEQLRSAQEQLEASRDRYIDLYENAPVGYATVGLTGRIVEINRQGVVILAGDAQRLHSRLFATYFSKESRASYETACAWR